MIDIKRNKRKYVQEILQQNAIFENRLVNQINPVLNKTWDFVIKNLDNGDVLGLIPTAVNRQTQDFQNKLYLFYLKVGRYYFDEVIKRIEDVKPKGYAKYNIKDAEGNFWYYFNLWCRRQALSKVTKMNETSKNILNRIIKKGVKDGKSYQEVAKDMLKTKIITNKFRALMIANTEMHTAFNKSIYESIHSNRIEVDEKEWINAGDLRVRSQPFNHVIANGEKVPFFEKFVLTGEPLEYPGDPNGSSGNIIRCRCAALYHTS